MKYKCRTCGKPLDGPPLGDDCFNCQDRFVDLEPSEFYRKYANVPLDKRFVPLSFKDGGMTLHDIYKRMIELDDLMRPMVLEQRELLHKAKDGFKSLLD